jgi:ABC-type bacteriocin/lantibiotic exporter with double-glycine peptidase domain
MSAAAATATAAPRRRWFAPEVVQTSAMDCGPAALKCVLEGFGIPVSYGRLREACQTSVDGTSIDTLEAVSEQLGVRAEQVLVPVDHLLLPQAQMLPAIVVVRHADSATHFVVVWRRVGGWLQVMDPSIGRRWVRCARFADEVYRHAISAPAVQWRAWAATDEFLAPLAQRLRRLGADAATAQARIDRALADRGWFCLGALDASVRLVQSLVDAGAMRPGAEALRLVRSLFRRARSQSGDIFAAVPAAYWSVVPDPRSAELGELQLMLRGAVLVRLGAAEGAARGELPASRLGAVPLPRELAAALGERAVHPMRTVFELLRRDGLFGPLALLGAIGIAVGALAVEMLLFRGLFGVAEQLGLPQQRLVALLALLGFAALLLCVEVPIVLESMRHGRRLETRLRMALLAKLPRLTDRYFQSRSVSDMADRSHGIQLARNVPTLGLHFVQLLAELLLTLACIALIAPASVGPAALIVLAAVAVPLVFQPLLNERDLRLRNHASALNGFYLDALLGLVPARTHRAERAVRRQHEGLLVEWARASRGNVVMSLTSGGVQGLLCTALAGWLLVAHFQRAGGVGGGDLLLVYWTLKLPSLGSGVGALARQYPAQRNMLLRLLEPLHAPEEAAAASVDSPQQLRAGAATQAGVQIRIDGGQVLAGGHPILRDVELQIGAGEHVAIVGASGAGKSSLLGLLLGWHRLAAGSLRVDGAELQAGYQDALRRQTAWVDPAVHLWNRSFLDNLGYASDDDGLARVAAVAEAAQLRSVMHKLPDGLQTHLGEGGALLSGGEGQRVRLGRALLQTGVRLALLDEPFRGLDRTQRCQLLDEARRWWHDATLLCVTHDVGETLAFGRVLVVEHGRIVEDGVPAELARQPSRYAAMLQAEHEVRSQMWQGAMWRRVRVEGGRVEAGRSERASLGLVPVAREEAA